MEHEFWQERWRDGRIAFHEGETNALLSRHFDGLGLRPGARVFVPLCGKANDLDWLLDQGIRVVGIELNQSAVEEVFDRLGLAAETQQMGALTVYRAVGIEIFVGDFFELTADALGTVDAVYDRAALVALPDGMRDAYAARLPVLTQNAPMLVITYDYDQSQMDGPPFSVPGAVIHRLYDAKYAVEAVQSIAIGGPLAERCQGKEEAWLLTPR